jgi:hypothetical protein
MGRCGHDHGARAVREPFHDVAGNGIHQNGDILVELDEVLAGVVFMPARRRDDGGEHQVGAHESERPLF